MGAVQLRLSCAPNMSSFKKKKFDDEKIEVDLKSFEAENDVKSDKDSKKKKEKVESVGLISMFQFADGFDMFLLFMGILFAIGCGAIFPVMFIMFGTVSNVFTQRDGGFTTDEQFMDQILEFVWQISAVGGAMWFSHYVFVACLNYTAERQVLRIRKEFFAAVLKQDIGWYDTTTTAEFASRMTEDLNKMQDGMGEKVGMLLRTGICPLS